MDLLCDMVGKKLPIRYAYLCDRSSRVWARENKDWARRLFFSAVPFFHGSGAVVHAGPAICDLAKSVGLRAHTVGHNEVAVFVDQLKPINN